MKNEIFTAFEEEEEESTDLTPAEALAAEVADDDSNEGTVTPDEVAEVLHLKKSGKTEEPVEDDKEVDNDEADNTDDTSDEDVDEEEVEEDEEQEVVDTEEKKFTLTVKDANGKEFTLQPGDDLEKMLEDFEPKSNGQIFSILQQLSKLETAKEQYATEQEETSKQVAYQEQVANIRTNWDKEIATLQGDKRIPVVADGKVPARVSEVFKFMQTQNDQRLKEGRPLLQSFEDALDKLELRESKDDTSEKNKEEKVLARKRGAIVGGSSAAVTVNTSNYRRGARTASEALKQMGVLR